MLRLPRNLYLTLRKCCACHEILLDHAKVLCPQRNLHLTLRKCCACQEICMHHLARPCQWDLRCVRASAAETPRLPRYLYLALRSAAPATKSIPRLAKVLRLPQNSNLAKPPRGAPVRDRSEPVRNRRRGRGTFRASAAATSCTLPRFCAFSIFSRAQIISFLFNSYPSTSFRTTEVPSKLPFTIRGLVGP